MQGSPLTGAIGANTPRFLNLHLGYVSLGARIAPRLPSFPTIYFRMMSARLRVLKLSLSYYKCMVLKEDVSSDSRLLEHFAKKSKVDP